MQACRKDTDFKTVIGEAPRNAIRPQLSGRSDKSVEYKHANISAVLVSMGLPYIDGYKPRANFQGLLAQAVESYLAAYPDYLDQLAAAPILSPAKPPATSLAAPNRLFAAPPGHITLPEPGKPWLSRKGRRIDFAQQDAANRQLGKMGTRRRPPRGPPFGPR
jgi:hypothetical protein